MNEASILEKTLSWLSTDPGKAVIAGGLGGLVRWITLRHSVKEGVVSIIVGGICANYLGPLVTPMLEATVGKIVPVQGLGPFIVGLAGISLTGMVMEVFERKRREVSDGKTDETRR